MSPESEKSVLKAVRLYPPSMRKIQAVLQLYRHLHVTFNGAVNILINHGIGDRSEGEVLEELKPYLYERHKGEDDE